MRLSDAIAIGRTLISPCEGDEYVSSTEGCARGMALEAVGKRLAVHGTGDNYEMALTIWPWLRQRFSALDMDLPCGCYTTEEMWLGYALPHIFDKHVFEREDWTLDQLIDWVRSVEPSEPEQLTVDQNFCDETAEKVRA